MKKLDVPKGLTPKIVTCFTRAGIPLEKETVIKLLKNGTLYPSFGPRGYGKYAHRDVCKWVEIDPATLPPKII